MWGPTDPEHSTPDEPNRQAGQPRDPLRVGRAYHESNRRSHLRASNWVSGPTERRPGKLVGEGDHPCAKRTCPVCLAFVLHPMGGLYLSPSCHGCFVKRFHVYGTHKRACTRASRLFGVPDIARKETGQSSLAVCGRSDRVMAARPGRLDPRINALRRRPARWYGHVRVGTKL
jgi:hypothetical protein